MKLSISKVIDRPPPVVWQFLVIDHIRNHPRWDSNMNVQQLTEGPIGMGTQIQRRHTRLGTPIEGTMEVVEFEPERLVGFVIRDQTPSGPLEVRSRMSLEPESAGGTTVTIQLVLPKSAPSMDPSMVEASLGKMKELIETET